MIFYHVKIMVFVWKMKIIIIILVFALRDFLVEIVNSHLHIVKIFFHNNWNKVFEIILRRLFISSYWTNSISIFTIKSIKISTTSKYLHQFFFQTELLSIINNFYWLVNSSLFTNLFEFRWTSSICRKKWRKSFYSCTNTFNWPVWNSIFYFANKLDFIDLHWNRSITYDDQLDFLGCFGNHSKLFRKSSS